MGHAEVESIGKAPIFFLNSSICNILLSYFSSFISLWHKIKHVACKTVKKSSTIPTILPHIQYNFNSIILDAELSLITATPPTSKSHANVALTSVEQRPSMHTTHAMIKIAPTSTCQPHLLVAIIKPITASSTLDRSQVVSATNQKSQGNNQSNTWYESNNTPTNSTLPLQHRHPFDNTNTALKSPVHRHHALRPL